MSEANNHEFDGPTQYPRPLEGLKPEIPSLTELTAQPKGRQRWTKPAEIAMTLLFAAGVAYFGWEMNSQDQAAKQAPFLAAQATSQAEPTKRATEFIVAAPATSTATQEPTATAELSPTIKPTIEATKAASPTPEAPKVILKTAQEVTLKLLEEAQKGNLLVVDVWSSKGITVEKTGLTSQTDALSFNGYKPGDMFLSPLVGKVDYISVIGDGAFKMNNINIKTDSIESSIVFPIGDKILVKDGDELVPGKPLAQLSGEKLPFKAGIWKNGQPFPSQVNLAAEVDKSKYPFGKNSILKENGMVVNIVPQSGK